MPLMDRLSELADRLATGNRLPDAAGAAALVREAITRLTPAQSSEQIAAELEQYAHGRENWGGKSNREAILLRKAAALLRLPRIESLSGAEVAKAILADYPDELDKAACDRCEQCGRDVLCSFHCVLSMLQGSLPPNTHLSRMDEWRNLVTPALPPRASGEK